MKITKEKVIYFLSLNTIPYLFIIPIAEILAWTSSHVLDPDKDVMQVVVITYIVILPASIVTFVYSFFVRNKKYSIFLNSLFTAFIPILGFLVFFLIFIFLDKDLSANIFGFFNFFICFLMLQIYLFSFIFSLIILKITDSLRRKIVW